MKTRFFILCLGILSGCGYSPVVARRAELDKMPTKACLAEALYKTNDITLLKMSEGEKPPVTPGYVIFFDYKCKGRLADACVKDTLFEFDKSREGRTIFTHTFVYNAFSEGMNGVSKNAAQKMVDTIRPVMKTVERNIETQCNLPGFAASIEEKCIDATCNNTESLK